MVECLPQAEAQPQPLSWCPSGDRSVLFNQTFTLTSRSLHLPVGGQLISSISFEMFGCQPFFFQNPGTWFSPSSGLSDSTFPQVSFLGQVLSLSGTRFCLFSSSSFLCLGTPLNFLSNWAPLFLLASTWKPLLQGRLHMTLLQCHLRTL